MEQDIDGFFISDDKSLLQPERIYAMLHSTYWASDRTLETMMKAADHSLCFGVYFEEEQIGFARCVTDYATTFLLADVVIDERFRGNGLGKALVSTVLKHEQLQGLIGSLATRDAHGLYAKYGFTPVDPSLYMRRPVQKTEQRENTHMAEET